MSRRRSLPGSREFLAQPVYRLRNAIGLRSPDDLSPIRQDVPREVEGLVGDPSTHS